jgi:Universal stress protein family
MLCYEETINQSKHLIHFHIFQPTRCLSNLDEIAIRIPYIILNLNTMVLWLCNEFSSSALPFLIRGPDISYTNNHEIGGFIRVGALIYAVTVTYIPASDHLSQKEVLSKSLVEDSSNKNMKDAGNWFENFTQNTKEDNIQLKTELINSARPVDYVILEYAEEQKIDLIVVGTKGRT